MTKYYILNVSGRTGFEMYWKDFNLNYNQSDLILPTSKMKVLELEFKFI